MVIDWQKEKLAERVGERILDIIEDRFGGNKSKFGKLLGIDNSGVNKIVTGQRSGLSFYQLYQLHQYCSQDLNELILGKNEAEETKDNADEGFSELAKLEIEHSRKEIEYLQQIIKDKEELLATKDMIIDYLKVRVTNLVAEMEAA
jgi:predicted transcriptional regulator